MNIRKAIITSAVFAVSFLAGCQGQGQTNHDKMRTDAADKLDGMTSNISYNQAKQAFEVGRFDRALTAINPIVARFPDNPRYRVLQGRILFESGKLDLASRSFVAAIEANPEFAEAYYCEAIINQRLSADDQAYQNYTKAFELEPTNVQYLMAATESMIALGDLDGASTLIDTHAPSFAGNAGIEQMKGQIALLKGDPSRAAQFYERARRLNPDDATLAEELAWAQFDAGQYSNCVETLHRMKTDFGTARSDMKHLEARCLAGMGQTSEARNLYLDLTRESPNSVDLWVELGLVAWELGDYHRVLQCSGRVSALDSGRYEGPLLRGVSARHHGRYQEAVEQLQRASQLSTHYAMPHILLGNTLELHGQSKSARAAYEKALTIEPDNNEAKILLARLDHEQRMRAVSADGAESMNP